MKSIGKKGLFLGTVLITAMILSPHFSALADGDGLDARNETLGGGFGSDLGGTSSYSGDGNDVHENADPTGAMTDTQPTGAAEVTTSIGTTTQKAPEAVTPSTLSGFNDPPVEPMMVGSRSIANPDEFSTWEADPQPTAPSNALEVTEELMAEALERGVNVRDITPDPDFPMPDPEAWGYSYNGRSVSIEMPGPDVTIDYYGSRSEMAVIRSDDGSTHVVKTDDEI